MSDEKKREFIRQRGRQRRMALKCEVFKMYGGPICICCGETCIYFLEVDHIHGGGSVHVKEIRSEGYPSLYDWLKDKDYPAGFQILCCNCNKGKALNSGVCPHHGIIRDLGIKPKSFIKKSLRKIAAKKFDKHEQLRVIEEFVDRELKTPFTIPEILTKGEGLRCNPWNRDRMKTLIPYLLEGGILKQVSVACGPYGAKYVSSKDTRFEDINPNGAVPIKEAQVRASDARMRDFVTEILATPMTQKQILTAGMDELGWHRNKVSDIVIELVTKGLIRIEDSSAGRSPATYLSNGFEF